MKGQRFRLDRGAVFIVVGSAFLWLCLKSVPLALTREVRIGAEGFPAWLSACTSHTRRYCWRSCCA